MPVRVVLVEPEKSGNIGAIARSMKNFALSDLHIVNPKAELDGEARAYAMHGLVILESASIVASLDDALKDVDLTVGSSAIAARRPSNLIRVAITPEELADKISSSTGTVALLFGRESTGLSNQELARCDLIVTIPASQEYGALNVATAASIVFYEIFLKRISKSPERQLASGPATQRLREQFGKLVQLSGLQPHRRRLAERAFRNVISRAFISKREASLLVGVFRKATSRK